MKDAFASLLRSRKFVVYVLVAIVGAAFVITGKLSVDRFDSFVSGLAGVLIAAIAYEDGQAKSIGVTVAAPADAAPVPLMPPPRPPSPGAPRDSGTRLAYAFGVGGVAVLCALLFLGCAPAADSATDAAAKAYRAEQDACFDAAERDSTACPELQPTRAACLATVRKTLHECRVAVQTRWGRA